jgi:hypothetical protein
MRVWLQCYDLYKGEIRLGEAYLGIVIAKRGANPHNNTNSVPLVATEIIDVVGYI